MCSSTNYLSCAKRKFQMTLIFSLISSFSESFFGTNKTEEKVRETFQFLLREISNISLVEWSVSGFSTSCKISLKPGGWGF